VSSPDEWVVTLDGVKMNKAELTSGAQGKRELGTEEMMLCDAEKGSCQSNISPLDEDQDGVFSGSLEK
jgi:hypothetical protein